MIAKWVGLLVGAVAALSSGCNEVTIDAPVGEELGQAEKAPLVGRLSEPHGAVTGEIQLAKDGRLLAGTLQWDDEAQEFRAMNHELHPRRLGSATYIYFAEEGDYSLLLAESVGGGEVRLFAPLPDKFREAVEKGQLPGKVTKNQDQFQVRLEASSPAVSEFLARAESRGFFGDEPALVIFSAEDKQAAEPANPAETAAPEPAAASTH